MINKATDHILQQTDIKAKVAIILGSGLGNFVESLTEKIEIPFADIPGFPVSTVQGHAGKIVYGYLHETPILINSGRVHFYEGYSLEQVIYPVQILHALGIEKLIITNAAGSIRKTFPPGSLMLINHLINLTGRSIYPDGKEPNQIFDQSTLEIVRISAKRAGIPLKDGVYTGLNGPSYETPAEIRFLRLKGADAVGMSTVHESLAAYRLGLDLMGISCLTNYAAGILDRALNHQEVIETGIRSQHDFSRLLSEIVKTLTEQ